MKLLICSCLTIILFGCQLTENWDDPAQHIESGNYSGLFIFTEHSNVSQGNVNFTFTSDSYTCVPEIPYLPPRGGGKYEIKSERILLTDLFPHTAEFDPSLILNGEFLFIKKNEVIIFIQKDKKRDRLRFMELTKQIDSVASK